MNTVEFLHILKDSRKLQAHQVLELEEIMERFPYFQATRALHLKALKNQNSFRYNDALKTTAIYTTDRSVLFNYITSSDFNNVVSQEEEAEIINQIEVVDELVIQNLENINDSKPSTVSETESTLETQIKLSQPMLSYNVDDTGKVMLKPVKDNEVVVNLELINAIQFKKEDKHSFNQWLQLSSFKPINRSSEKVTPEKVKNRKIIDKFISNKIKLKPRVKPSKLAGLSVDFDHIEEIGARNMMTETLAKLFIQQKKYKEAIEAYDILSLKIPEKSSFFADRIAEIRKFIP